MKAPTFSVVTGDVRNHDCDVLVLKYAQTHYGADDAVTQALSSAGISDAETHPPTGGYRIIESRGAIQPARVMFAGVSALRDFDYESIRAFARKSMEDLAGRDLAADRVAYTMHGPGYGLDEREAFNALVAGLTDAIERGDVPGDLQSVTFVERNPGRARRMAEYLRELDLRFHERDGGASSLSSGAEGRLRSAGAASSTKPHVFVAMPFSESRSDHFHYGIQPPINNAGLLCERLDFSAFTGDVVTRIKERISTATLVVADLSSANANVYLEVGYAWGRGVATVLLCDAADELKFDVQGQKCLMYKSIRDLEQLLTAELIGLTQPV
jgi:hypothetical protein